MSEENALALEVRIKSSLETGLQEAAGLKVVDQESADRAGIIASKLKAGLKEWEDYWKPLKASAKATHAKLCDAEGEALKRVKPVIVHLGEQASAWVLAEREKFRKAQEARERAEWEAKRKAEKAEEKVEAVSGFESMAAAIAEIPQEDLGPAPVAPTVEGAEFRDHWIWAVAEFDDIPRRFLAPDKDAIDAEIAAKKDKTEDSVKNLIAGIRVYNRPIMASKRRTI
jgi:hypothetical protein